MTATKVELDTSFARLFSQARAGGLNYFFTLLRVEGITQKRDPLLDLSDQMQVNKSLDRNWYCSLLSGTETSLAVILNLTRCIQGEPFDLFPFRGLLPQALHRREEDRPAELGTIAARTSSALDAVGFEDIANSIREAFPGEVLRRCVPNEVPDRNEADVQTFEE
ncbi:MAG: hypothetical protein LC672_06120, partial [Acidobacteria bacterium]|nr:hypothetical protein [Acidobacteriota bacterium]